MSQQWILVTQGQTVHLRKTAETNTSNVITELPRGYCVTMSGSLDPFKSVTVWDGIEEIEGYVHRNYLTSSPMSCSENDLYIPRYSTTYWNRSSHHGRKYRPVEKIQQDLLSLGYTQLGNADGYYGANTESAVKAFQSANGLNPDGIFGPLSKLALWELIN